MRRDMMRYLLPTALLAFTIIGGKKSSNNLRLRAAWITQGSVRKPLYLKIAVKTMVSFFLFPGNSMKLPSASHDDTE